MSLACELLTFIHRVVVMRNLFRSSVFAASTVLLPLVAQAHPGHDDHEFTWDFSHLAAHPSATLGCVAVVAAAGAIVWRVSRLSSGRSRARQ